MLEEIKNIKSGKSQLRQFGITLGSILGLLGGWFFLRQKDYYLYPLVLSGVFVFLGLIAPTLLRPIQKIWMSLAIFIGWCMTRIILVILFFLVVTPIGLLARISGKSFLDTRLDRNTDSYWTTRRAVKFDKRSYENQF